MTKGFLLLVLASCVSFAASCPSNTYVECGDEGGRCNIPTGITKGYVSYGANGRYTFIPFSKQSSDTLDMECDNDFGDIYPGTTKYCCYRSIDIGFDEAFYSSTYAFTWEGGSYNTGEYNTFPASMKYGINDKYVYRVMADANVPCNNDFFNDVVPHVRKHCKFSEYEPPMITSTNWYHCADEGGDCDLQDSNAHWVRYGEGSSFYYRLVAAGNNVNNKIGCNNNIFDDPKGGTSKFCWRSESTPDVY